MQQLHRNDHVTEEGFIGSGSWNVGQALQRFTALAADHHDETNAAPTRCRYPQSIWLKNSLVRGSLALSKKEAGGPNSTILPPSVK